MATSVIDRENGFVCLDAEAGVAVNVHSSETLPGKENVTLVAPSKEILARLTWMVCRRFQHNAFLVPLRFPSGSWGTMGRVWND